MKPLRILLVLVLASFANITHAIGYNIYYCQPDVDGDHVGAGIVFGREYVCSTVSEVYLGMCDNSPYTGNCGTYTAPTGNNDNCPNLANSSQTDSNHDGVGDACQGDRESDGVPDASDNCPLIVNSNQLNTDGDSQGNVCDDDDDNDGLTDAQEITKGTNSLLSDTDSDTLNDSTDNCPLIANTNQLDSNSDGVGDACSAGAPDANFSESGSLYGINSAYAVVIQPDGKILLGGDFNIVNGVTQKKITRLNDDGSLDASFNAGSGMDLYVRAIGLQADGKIIVGGSFTQVNGTPRNRIARLNADGSLDTGFDAGNGTIYSIQTIVVQPDGQIMVAGDFTSIGGGFARSKIARLNTDGSLDASFNPGSGANSVAEICSLQTNGDMIIFGGFSFYDGILKTYIARINAEGALDASFNPNIDSSITDCAEQADGKLVIGGAFTTIDGITRNRVARLNADGSLDSSFNPGSGPNGNPYTLGLQADGKVLVSGTITTFNGIPRNPVTRLNSDGSLDTTFAPHSGVTGAAEDIAIQTDGKILLAGSFNNNGVKGSILRLYSGDGDNDNMQDAEDAFPSNAAAVTDTDNDGMPDAWLPTNPYGCIAGEPTCNSLTLDDDDDNDGVADASDLFPLDATESVDTDGDGVGNNADATPNGDTDSDGVDNLADNCVAVSNVDQLNTDGDTQGDACDTTPNGDTDNDGVDNNSDNCPTVSNADQTDLDADGAGDVCDLFPLDDALLLEQNGIAKNENFASSIAMADMNADGVIDVLVGAPMANILVDGKILKKAGVIRIISGADNSILYTLNGSETNQQFGTAIAVVDDQNSDSMQDIVVGEPLADITTTVLSKTRKLKNAGRVAVYSGIDGALLSVIAEGSKASDHFGAAVVTGDVNNDAEVDLIVGAPLVDTTEKNTGQVTVFNGLNSAVLYQRSGDQAGENFGAAVAVDQQRLFVGSPLRDHAKLKDVGRVQIFNAVNGDGAVLLTLEGTAKNDHLGAAVSAANDEWAVGIPLADNAGKNAGSVHLFNGLNITPVTTLSGKTAGDNFGSAVNMQGDVNKDGENDLAIGAAKFDASTVVEKRHSAGIKTVLLKDAGRVEVLSGVAL